MATSEARLDPTVRRARARLDTVRDQLAIPALRRRAQALVRRLGLTRTGQIAVVASVVPWIVARVVAGTALYIFAYGTVMLVVASALLAPRKLRLTADRTGLFPRAQEGDRLEVVVTITAGRSLSSFQVEERTPERLGTPVRVPIAKVRKGEAFVYTYSLQCSRRGVYQIGPLVAIAQDPIGVGQRETILAEPFELLVHPGIARVSDRPLTRLFEDPPIRPPVSKPWPSGMEFFGMREFRPGDDLRRVVWRAMARTGKVMVREAEQGITDHVTLIIDTDRGSHSRDGEGSESFETAIRAAASLGVRHLHEGYEIRCETNAGPLTRNLRGSDKATRFLDAMARADLSREPLRKALRRLVADPRRDAHTILVTPRLELDEVALVRMLIDKGVSMTVVAVIWDEQDAEVMGRAAAMGCQVAAVRAGDDLATALRRDIGAGNRL